MILLNVLRAWIDGRGEDEGPVLPLDDEQLVVRMQLDAMKRELKELDVQLAIAELALKARGWMPAPTTNDDHG